MPRLLTVCLLLSLAPSALAQSTAETIGSVTPKMVKIFGAGGIRRLHSHGTGFLVTKEGHIATVWNHILDADAVTVVLADGRRFKATVLGAEPPLDLAVLKIQAEGLSLPFFDLKKLGTAAPGARILGFSNMFKVATGDEPVSVLHGVIATKTKLTARRGAFEAPYRGPVYISDAITNNPGAAGGVITTRDGKLLGMIGREVRDTRSNAWINYAIPVSELRETIEQIISGNFTSTKKKPDADSEPNRYDAVDFGLVMVPDVVNRTPAYVVDVKRGSPADMAGIRPDDLVLFVNDELIQSNKLLDHQLGLLEAGDTLRIIVRRGGSLVTVEMPVHRKMQK